MDGRLIALMSAQLVAFWPVFGWWARRLSDGPDSLLGLAPLALALLLRARERRGSAPPDLRLPAALIALYALTYPLAPPLLRAALAVLSLSCTLGPGKAPGAGVAGLVLLSLPVLPTAHYVAGYPLRVVIGKMTAAMLGLSGVAVKPVGACLEGERGLVCVDAPCSGVSMLWASLVLVFVLASLYRLPAARTAALAAASVAIVMAANAMRASALYLAETRLPALPPWAHAGVGVVVFALVTASLSLLGDRLKEQPCAA